MTKKIFDLVYNKLRLTEEYFRSNAILLSGIERSIQLDNYSCAVQSVYVILKYFDFNHSHKFIEEKLGTSTEDGTDTEPILTFLKSMNLKVEVDEKSNLNVIKDNIKKGYPMLITIHDWEHWVTIYGYSDSRIFVLDSNKKKLKNSYSIEEFLKTWDDNWIAVIKKE